MADLVVILLRWTQFLTAAILMGSSLFFVYGLPRDAYQQGSALGVRGLVIVASFGLAAVAAMGLFAQTTVMAGSFDEAIEASSLEAVVGMDLGKAAIVRVACGLAAGLFLIAVHSPRRGAWITLGLLGTAATASFAWSGHGASSEETAFWIHLFSDIIHSWAAAGWIGALFVFTVILRNREQSPGDLSCTHLALSRFSTYGTIFVLVLLATGLINSWYLVGLERSSAFLSTPYGQLLVLKLLAFAGMLALAATNKFRLTPQLTHGSSLSTSHRPALAKLRRSVAIEGGLGLLALALVAWFGTLEPPSAA